MYTRTAVTPLLLRYWGGITTRNQQKLWLISRTKATVAPATNPDTLTGPKPVSEIPGPKGFFQVASNTLEGFRYFGQGHILVEKKFAKYGPIYMEKIGLFSFVQLCNVDDIELVHRTDSKYPHRIAVQAWISWRENEKLAKGILIENDGPKWKRMRAQLDKRMMRPKHVASYTGHFNDVITDFISRLKHIRATEGKGIRVPNLDQELFHWSLETIGTVLYERRFGGFALERAQETSEFINAVQDVFRTTEKIFAFPLWLAKYISPASYKAHVKAWRTIFATGTKLIDEKMEEIQKKLDKGEEVDGFLSTLLASKSLSQSEVYANISELMLGAVDTTSNTMQWVIYELSRHPDIQERLRDEIMSVTNGDVTDHAALQKMPYLKAVIKEALRLYPIAGVVTRIIQEDVVLSGYNIPKGTTIIASTYMTGRNQDIYEDPETFRPERWLRSEQNTERIHSFAWLPFGFGPRMCIGRRVAELEMHLLTARLLQKFRLEPLSTVPLKVVTRGLFVPEKSVDVKFIDI